MQNTDIMIKSLFKLFDPQNHKQDVLTVKMPDEESSHKSNNSNKNRKADHSSYFAQSVFLLKLFIVRRWQKLDWSVPIIVLENKDTLV